MAVPVLLLMMITGYIIVCGNSLSMEEVEALVIIIIIYLIVKDRVAPKGKGLFEGASHNTNTKKTLQNRT